jgi:hypothetical protein
MYMVEEEKMAMDVYAKMFDLYGLIIFDNINQSEARHVAAVSRLIDKYELDNPIIGNPPGVFVNEELQKTYDDLIEKGSVSKLQAKYVGVTIEEQDIIDINNYLEEVVQSEDLEKVYSNLLSGSNSHLESFLAEID